LGYENTKKIIARTWYRESVEKLLKLGFNKVAVVEDDIVPGRTSYYLEGDLDFIVDNILNRKTVPLLDFRKL